MTKTPIGQNGSYDVLWTVLNSLDALVYVIDVSTYEVLYMNEAAKRVWGNLVGEVCWKRLGNGAGPCRDCPNATGSCNQETVREFFDNTGGKWYSSRDRIMDWVDGRLVRVGVATDISERKAVEEALRESEERYRQLVEMSPAAILVEKDNTIVTANLEALRLLGNVGSEEVVGSKLSSVLQQACYQAFRSNIGRSLAENAPIECEIVRSDGSAVTVELSVAAMGDGDEQSLRILIWDLTEQKQKEEEHIKATRLESIGLLAGGIAHDFNNILTIISGYLSIARIYAKDNEQVQLKLTEIDKATKQAVALTQQLLTFAKGGAPVKRIMSLDKLVEETVQFSLSGSNVRWTYRQQEGLPCAEVDEGQLGQVVSNLVINADQAMPNGGVIEVQLSKEQLPANNPLKLAAGNYIVLSIADQGQGISDEDLPKIFDPYFTTKSDGSGLGLATSYSIIKRHGGHIQAISSPGRGSTFFVYLPAASGTDTLPAAEPSTAYTGSGKILVMDDEPGIRKLLSEMLTLLGYEADYAENGEDAVAMYARALNHNNPYDAVILDLTIRDGLGGRETLKKLEALNPNIQAIVSSGYSTDSVLAEYNKYGFSAVVKKPYRMEELGSALHSLLNKPHSG